MKKPKMNWRTALANMRIKTPKKKEADMIFEIDGANGEKLTFPDANDVTEIEEGSTVTAEDGEHVFVSEGNTYTITVASGKVTKLEVVPVEEVETEMSAETVEMLEAVAAALDSNETDILAIKAENVALKSELAEMKESVKGLKALMSHAEDDDDEEKKKKKTLNIGGKKVDLTKINLT